MTEAKKADFRKRIQSEIEKTAKNINELEEFTRPIGPENAIGRVSRMDAINNKSINDAAMREAKNKLKNLETALSRINQADFGICLRCKKPIPEGRLLLMPGTKTCVNCAR